MRGANPTFLHVNNKGEDRVYSLACFCSWPTGLNFTRWKKQKQGDMFIHGNANEILFQSSQWNAAHNIRFCAKWTK